MPCHIVFPKRDSAPSQTAPPIWAIVNAPTTPRYTFGFRGRTRRTRPRGRCATIRSSARTGHAQHNATAAISAWRAIPMASSPHFDAMNDRAPAGFRNAETAAVDSLTAEGRSDCHRWPDTRDSAR